MFCSSTAYKWGCFILYMNAKYFNKKRGQTILHCPNCRGVVIKLWKPGSKNSNCNAQLRLRCPHCQKNIFILYDHGKPTVSIVEEEPENNSSK